MKLKSRRSLSFNAIVAGSLFLGASFQATAGQWAIAHYFDNITQFTSANHGTAWDAVTVNTQSNGYRGYITSLNSGTPLNQWTPEDGLPDPSNSEMSGNFAWTYKFVDFARNVAGVPLITENYTLDLAARILSDEMLNQGWIGVRFPDGKNLEWALSAAGYTGDPKGVRALVFATSDSGGLGSYLYFGSPWPNAGRPWIPASRKYPLLVSSEFPTFGYANTDSGDVASLPANEAEALRPSNPNPRGFFVPSEVKPRLMTQLIEVFLFSSNPETYESRALWDTRQVPRNIDRLSRSPLALDIAATQGMPILSAGIVVDPRELVGPARITRGHLPPGVHFLKRSGRFVGSPQKSGRFVLKIKATYKTIATPSGPEGGNGTATLKVTFHVQ